MRKLWLIIVCYVIAAVLVIPSVVAGVQGIPRTIVATPSGSPRTASTVSPATSPTSAAGAAAATATANPQVRVYDRVHGGVRKLSLEEYVVGVTAAEMPAGFAPEALKAQAVVARTYAWTHLRQNGGRGCSDAPEADFCSDAESGQAWISTEEMQRRWGSDYGAYIARIKQAVTDTQGQIAVYDGQPIQAYYYSSAGGQTEDARQVWGTSLPYLVSVPSPDRDLPTAVAKTIISEKKVAAALGVPTAALHSSIVPASTKAPPAVVVLSRTASGRAERVQVGEVRLDAITLRQKLGLPSTIIVGSEWQGGQLIVETRGYGHGVGMSQYGANAMAQQGDEYAPILRHYYPGTELAQLGS